MVTADIGQNGLGVEEDLYQAVKQSGTPIISSCAWIGIMTSRDGKLVSWLGQVESTFLHRLILSLEL